MIAIQIADFFILKKDVTESDIYYKNMVIWLVGFVANRVFLKMDLLIGSTISCIIVVILVKVLAEKLIKD